MATRTPEDFAADQQFEDEVLRIARLVYPDAIGGPTVLTGQERDGILVGRDVAVAIEATRSRKADKVEKDATKLAQVVAKLAKEHPAKAVKGFCITAEEPTADQRDRVKRHGGNLVSIMSLVQLRRQLFDAMEYLAARDQYAFGSARDLRTNDYRFSEEPVPMELLEKPALQRAWSTTSLRNELVAGRRAVLTGEFGVGKSISLRQVYRALASAFRKDATRAVPVHLNLRDHRGQDDPVEALHRHARLIGFARPDDLVRGWRAGQIVLILDGFDEITYPGWAGRVVTLADVRRANVALIRKFLAQTPSNAGVLIAGRAHFFDSDAELQRALGTPHDYLALSASDFSPEQVEKFLVLNHLDVTIPEWLPRRPLLLGHLALAGALGDTAPDGQMSPAAGWDAMLNRVAEREAEMEAGVDGHSVRRILERAATRARRTTSGRGPLRFDDLTSAFRDACGYEPDEGTRVVLDRLPGLGVAPGSSDTSELPREFVDSEYADVARAGDVFEFIRSPHAGILQAEDVYGWVSLLDDVGLEVVWHRLDACGLGQSSVQVALDFADTNHPDSGLVVELLRLVTRQGGDVGKRSPHLSNHLLPSLTLAGGNQSGAVITDSIVERLDISADPLDWQKMPYMRAVHFEEVQGVTGPGELPTSNFSDCTFETFQDGAANSSEILDLQLSDQAKVTLILLKKLYRQRGSGRKDSAMRRGGLSDTQRNLVPEVLERLLAEKMVVKGKSGGTTLWLPVAAARSRAQEVLAAPLTSTDPLIR